MTEPTAVEPNPEERERVEILRVLHKHSTRDADIAVVSILAVLRAAGFGDVAAERKTAAHARRKATEHWNRAEALQARIDAAPHAMHCEFHTWQTRPGPPRGSAPECTCWKSAALTVDEPAPEPPKLDPRLREWGTLSPKPLDPRDEVVSEEVRATLWPDAAVAWRCHYCRLVYSNPASHLEFYPRCSS